VAVAQTEEAEVEVAPSRMGPYLQPLEALTPSTVAAAEILVLRLRVVPLPTSPGTAVLRSVLAAGRTAPPRVRMAYLAHRAQVRAVMTEGTAAKAVRVVPARVGVVEVAPDTAELAATVPLRRVPGASEAVRTV